jgi:hypothetical protein
MIIKYVPWSGKTGGLALPMGSSRRAASRYRPTKVKDTADLIIYILA